MCLIFNIAPMTLEIDIQVAQWFKILRTMRETLPVEDYDIREEYFQTVKQISEHKKKFYAEFHEDKITAEEFKEFTLTNNSLIRKLAEQIVAHKKRLSN